MDKKPTCITDDGKARWHSDDLINWEWQRGRLKLQFHMRKNNGAMGRLGGGWLWKLGIDAARSGFVLYLFVAMFRCSWSKP